MLGSWLVRSIVNQIIMVAKTNTTKYVRIYRCVATEICGDFPKGLQGKNLRSPDLGDNLCTLVHICAHLCISVHSCVSLYLSAYQSWLCILVHICVTLCTYVPQIAKHLISQVLTDMGTT